MKIIAFLVLSSLVLGCSHFSRNTEPSTQATVPEKPAVVVHEQAHVTQTPFANGGQVVVSELGAVPVEINSKVLHWVDYFQSRGRPHMERYLSRSTRHMKLMKKILREEGVPEDLVYIALIESGFNYKAHSRASAVGYWQFIRGTGKRYGLRINGYVDERRDVEMSTRASANYFKSLYNLFGNWYLAMASYNAGENRIKRAVMKYQTRDFWKLARDKRLPKETSHYVPKYLAAAMIAKNPSRYGFAYVNYEEEIEYDTIYLLHAVSLKKLARKMGIKTSDIRDLNPALRSNFIPAYRGGNTSLKIPKGMSDIALASLSKARAKAPRYISGGTHKYRVRRGDSLSTIARKFRTSVRKLKSLNGLRRSTIRVGQRLKVPEKYASAKYGKIKGGKAIKKVSVNRKSSSSGSYEIHRVRRGESLWTIARKYNMHLSEIMKLDKLSRRSVIKVGMRLKVKLKKDKSKVHVVRRGETLLHIAKRYKVSLSKLTRANAIRPSSKLMAGRSLVIP